ncbi:MULTISPECIES: HAD family hydrolase [unclassified Paenibacillus]|uniref:HAD family hydrolase n=1 Tax=unclassified Paenibacillus TaxID=185978 RepID=UPI000956EAF6|nr:MULTISPECIES: HAD family hydrolase [unclassified Paenibacillus]ASS65407.1 HAD family hydrolase [Paenibacillus sp. RUD330]SIQ37286.1 haloacid dehalogenase superfamily, subfamily IA, variant 3 with third motif having DD or ED/haloacid dehalogenase superfamily, subfamily IA, variant 1 with third motif having Dx(3-4)D or Dx(3-4)E/beta-phosphoglucomutase family hydrolase [Paenibacillus sp. RU4X]SIQ59366.1 haloacid dehalogenase superfamily, subfamily IA, variant 3 with third motif having DD or ED/h
MNAWSLSDWQESPIQAVLFDMDGVLVDSEPIYFEIERSSFVHFGASVDDEEHHGYVGITLETMWRRVLDKHRINASLEEVLSHHKEKVLTTLARPDRLEAMPDVERLLGFLQERQVPLAVASSSPRALIEIIMERTGLGKYFDVKVSGEEVDRGKPAPDIFLHAASLLNAEPASCLVIEDSRNGVQAAKSAGMRCIGYRNPGSGNQDLAMADVVITAYRELLDIRDTLPISPLVLENKA